MLVKVQKTQRTVYCVEAVWLTHNQGNTGECDFFFFGCMAFFKKK